MAFDREGAEILEQLNQQIHEKENEGLDSTRRMIGFCEESKDMGIKTLVMLDEQGVNSTGHSYCSKFTSTRRMASVQTIEDICSIFQEQLDKIEETMKGINNDMKVAEDNLVELEKCCGLCVLPWKKRKRVNRDKDYAVTLKTEGGVVHAQGPGRNQEQMMIGGKLVTTITGNAVEKEMEDNMQDVANMVSNLRNMAVDIGSELDSQNRQIDRIDKQADMNNVRIVQANERTNKLI